MINIPQIKQVAETLLSSLPPDHLRLTTALLNECRETQLKFIHNGLADRARRKDLITDADINYITSIIFPYSDWKDKPLIDRYSIIMIADELQRHLHA